MTFKKNILAAVLIISSAISFNSFAQVVPDAVGASSGTLKWNGNIVQACNLSGFIDGTVVANSNQTKLTSLLDGGSKSKVDIRTNADGYTLVFGTPQLWKDGTDVSWMGANFNISPVGSGRVINGTPIGEFGATQGNLFFTSAGFYQANVDAEVTAASGAAFPAGSYTVKVPVSCVINNA